MRRRTWKHRGVEIERNDFGYYVAYPTEFNRTDRHAQYVRCMADTLDGVKHMIAQVHKDGRLS
jgi:hypothetical protein